MSSNPETQKAKEAFIKLAVDLAAINPRYKFEETNYSEAGGKIRRYDDTISNMYVEVSINFPHSGWNRVYTKPNLYFDTNNYNVQFHRNLKLYQIAIEDKVHTKVEEMFADLRERDLREKEKKANQSVCLKEFSRLHRKYLSPNNYDTKMQDHRIETKLTEHSDINDEIELGVKYDNSDKTYNITSTTNLTLEQFEAIKKIVFRNV